MRGVQLGNRDPTVNPEPRATQAILEHQDPTVNKDSQGLQDQLVCQDHKVGQDPMVTQASQEL